MRKILTLVLIFYIQILQAQAQGGNCNIAIPLAQTSAYCSNDGEFSINPITGSVWFIFTATASDINLTVSGLNAGGTLPSPTIQLFVDCMGTELVGTGITENNVTTFYKGGLVIGNTYYLEVTGSTGKIGSFKLCLNNYEPIIKAGQDCGTASFLCSTQTISQNNVVGAGLNNNEAKGTCLDVGSGEATESNSVWYKWQAANNGTLVFTITPNSIHDDIDWVLFDLGPTGDCANVTPVNAIRCKAGYGVDNSQCPTDTIYYKTGLDFNETDLSEPPGCGKGQNGKVKYVTCQQGHYYGLLVNNFSSGNNGFTLAFSDQHNKAGTVTFEGPHPAWSYSVTGDCTTNPQYSYTSASTNYNTLKWFFGDGASLSTASNAGPYTISYSTPGIKTISLEAMGQDSCIVVASQQITVGIKPPLPQIKADKADYCVSDTVRLSADEVPGLSYSWTGPNGFHSDSSIVMVPVTGIEISGTYKLLVSSYGCISDTAYISLPLPLASPTAAFHTDPSQVDALYGPVTIQFINDTFNADTYKWDFGDGSSSTAENPSHTYVNKGTYNVRLTASRSNSCTISVIKYSLAIIQNNNYIFIPNTFTPNGDGINDVFNVTITNLKTYHIQIFTRWGQPIFESKSIINSWDGNYNGKQMPFGVYYYVIDGLGTDNAIIKRSGYITLIR